MTVNVAAQFPGAWLTTVSVEREGVKDPKGNVGPSTSHQVEGCLVTTQSTEEEARADLPDTSAYLYAGPGADFAARDIVTVPEGARLWPWGRFRVNGEPDFGPLGTRVQLRRV